MCGILLSYHVPHPLELIDKIAARGPDALETRQFGKLTVTASVLHLRGLELVRQPFETQEGVLLWNGEAWQGLALLATQNDTQALAKALQHNTVLQVFSALRGPFAFCYLDKQAQCLWYGRDVLGRRSLLINQQEGGFLLSSVGTRDLAWCNVEPGLHCFDLASETTQSYAWTAYGQPDALVMPYAPVCTTHAAATLPLPVDDLKQVLLNALLKRICNTLVGPLAIMYSGGVDCAVLARLAHDLLPSHQPVELINVSFENPRSLRSQSAQSDPYDTPDRLTGEQGFQELQQMCPDRDWRFICVNVPYTEAIAAKDIVLDLMYPNDSTMDHSIALAFYFCARGSGLCQNKPYQSTAKVYLSGLGADELLGGYSRHKRAATQGHAALIAELQCDLDRLPSRNLGRDDRILSHFGREVRWPFLDEDVIHFLTRLPVSAKMRHDREGGDKLLLRELARSIGIPQAAAQAKRAVQFGSRSAKMELGSGKSQGHDKLT